MTENRDIAVPTKKVYELSILQVPKIDARKWEALRSTRSAEAL